VSRTKAPKGTARGSGCHHPVATPCGEYFVAGIRNRGKKFVTEEGTLTSSKGGAEHFDTAAAALTAAKAYVNAHFSN